MVTLNAIRFRQAWSKRQQTGRGPALPVYDSQAALAPRKGYTHDFYVLSTRSLAPEVSALSNIDIHVCVPCVLLVTASPGQLALRVCTLTPRVLSSLIAKIFRGNHG